MVSLKINNISVSVPEGTTILDAAQSIGITIPTLCYMREINEIGACRICVVDVKGARNLVTACVYPVTEGMEVTTNSKRVFDARRTNLELVLSTHDKDCLACERSNNCELQKLSAELGVSDSNKYAGFTPNWDIDISAEHMVRDNNKCILCRRCVAVCDKWQNVAVIGANERGFDTNIGCAFDLDLAETSCISCGQCVSVCPTGALTEKSAIEDVLAAIEDPTKHVVVQTAPSVRATLGECFGMPIGTDVEGKMAASLHRLGFDGVYDTDFSADFTIVEEANELMTRIKDGGALPMITSCSPGWVKYCEYYFPDMIPNLSSCKSPQQMFGAIAKTWYAKKNNIDPADMYVVSVMPCTAKKFERGRDDQAAAGKDIYDVDAVLTTRELAKLINRAGIDFVNLPDESFDNPLGESTGAAVIFGATGGVMEAALRTAAEWITGDTGAPVEFGEVRGTKGIKEATYKVGELEVNVAVASGLQNAKELLEAVQRGEKNYHFIEIMACPGGCVNGGGQPIQPASVRNFTDLKTLRASALYKNDSAKTFRKSHDNPVLKTIYEEYFKEPGSHTAHKVLHTHYVRRSKFRTID